MEEMTMANEQRINNLFEEKINKTEGYPATKDKPNKEGVIVYKEDSYKGKDEFLEKAFSTASKAIITNEPGRPDFTIDTPNFYLIIESKYAETKTPNAANRKHRHSRYTDVKQYIKPNAVRDDEVYDTKMLYISAIDDSLFYSSKVNSKKDVISIAVSGTNENDFRLTSFFLPKGEKLSKIVLIEDGGWEDTFKSVKDYQREIYKCLGYEEKLYQDVYEDLRKYADACAKFLNTNGIDENDRLGLVSAIVLALTNEDSILYKHVINGNLDITPSEVKDALISPSRPFGVVISDKLPIEKQNVLTVYFNGLLDKPILSRQIVTKNKNGKVEEVNAKDYFEEGKGYTNTIISRVVYSLYKFIIKVYDKYQTSSIDVMGTFYSLFLQYAKGDAKKGVVLTPKHITDLFCEIAEYYYGNKFITSDKNGNVKNVDILDICTGSGGFLIAALNRMDKEIESLSISDDKKEETKEKVRKNSLIGVELKDSMFVLAYANMRFHRDGKSSLYHGSSLYSSKEILADNKTLKELLITKYKNSDKTGPEIGLINPPYEEDVFEFIDSMLRYLNENGIGIAIVPINTQGVNDEVTSKKNDLLSRNSLLASILMPPDLFNGVRGSGSATSTCILVFRAHVPHAEFLKNGGLTYLADWSSDGFKLVPKHGRFEQDDKWYNSIDGYKKLYLQDMKKVSSEEDSILSTLYKKDIHKEGSVKSIRKAIHKFDRIEVTPVVNKQGNPVYKKNKIPRIDVNTGEQKLNKNGAPLYDYIDAKDENGELIIDTKETEIYLNEDWNILDYVKTNYDDLTDNDFVKTLLDYNLFLYMKENNMLFNDDEE